MQHSPSPARRRARRRHVGSRLTQFENLEARCLLATITVNSVVDSNARDSALTYREAILVANGTLAFGSLSAAEQAQISGTLQSGTGSPPDVIAFNIPGAGLKTLAINSPLPDITDPVVIDGYTQPGSAVNSLPNATNANLLIAAPVPTIVAGHSTVRGLVITGGNLVLRGGQNLVEGNFIGTTADGSSGPSLTPGAPPQRGIIIESDSNSIGGLTAASHNLISGNNQAGIHIAGGSNNLIAGNLIGTNAVGSQALANGIGVWITHGSNNSVGGTAAGAGNVISANTVFGIRLAPEQPSDSVTATLIAGNRIGTNGTGSAPLGNGAGVFVNAANTTLGGTAANAANIISGNPGGGLGLFNSTNTVVEGNRVGISIDGNTAIPNGEAGIVIGGGSGNVLGGNTFDARNVVSGNTGHGIVVTSPGLNTVIRGNFIGVTANGVSPLGNGGSGIRVTSAGAGILIGGPTITDGNVIYYNANGGVVVLAGTGVQIRSNSIYGNAGPGIDLGGDGNTPNDPGDSDTGPNNLQNAPVLTSVNSDGSTTSIGGNLNSTPNTTFTLQFFSNSYADPTNVGEGLIYLGDAQVQTNGSGNVTFVASVDAGVAPGQPIVAVAIDPNGNTSEFSINLPYTPNPAADLGVTIQSNADTVLAGQNVTFTVTVSNQGPNSAANVSLVSGLGAGAILVSATPSQGAVSTLTGAVEASLGTIASGASATVTVVLRRDSAGALELTGLVYSAASDPNAENNTNVKTVNVLPVPNINTNVSAPSQISVNGNATFIFTVTNPGPATATNVVLTTDTLPAGTTLVSAGVNSGSSNINGGVVTATFGSLASGASATLTVVLNASQTGTLTYGATATLSEPDPDTSNNRAVASVSVVVPPDLTISVHAAPNPVLVNQPITYTIVAVNHGPTAANGVVITATLSPAGTFISANPSQGTATPVEGVITANLGTIPAGGSASVVVIVTPSAAGVATLDANVAAAVESDTTNNHAAASVTVNPIASPVFIQNISALTTSGGFRGFVVNFSGPVDPAGVARPSAYQIIANGRLVPIKSIGYDVLTFTAVIISQRPLPANQFVGFRALGTGASAILSAPDTPIDGNSDGVPGGDFAVTIARGRNLRYVDSTGDRVSINLVGLGALEMVRGPEGEARVLRAFNTTPRRSTVSGSVVRGPRGQGDGVTRIPFIEGFGSFTNRLPAARFRIG